MYLLAFAVFVLVNFQYVNLIQRLLNLLIVHFISQKLNQGPRCRVYHHLALQFASSSSFLAASDVVDLTLCFIIKLNLIAALTIDLVLEICPLDAINLYSNFIASVVVDSNFTTWIKKDVHYSSYFNYILYRCCYVVENLCLFELFIMSTVKPAGLD